jgi:endonuclease YncB( thermonuclease family)
VPTPSVRQAACVKRGLVVLVLSCGCPIDVPSRPVIPSRAELSLLGPTLECTLERWEDGDTPYVRCEGGDAPEPVRLIGIDTAESGFDNNSVRRAGWQAELWGLTYDEVVACGKTASERANALCGAGSRVQVVGPFRDKYDRRLGYVTCDDVEINGRLVHEGLAGRYPFPDPPERPQACAALSHK